MCFVARGLAQFPHQPHEGCALLPPAHCARCFGKQANALFLARGLLMVKFVPALREATNLRRLGFFKNQGLHDADAKQSISNNLGSIIKNVRNNN